jgi:hypothetical protein
MPPVMRIFLTVLFIAFIGAALTVAWFFGGLGVDQFIYLATLIIGWTAWTLAIAVLYRLLEKLFPNVLCAPLVDEPSGAGPAEPRPTGTFEDVRQAEALRDAAAVHDGHRT